MPISLNRVGAPAFDVAALQAAIDARSLQAAQNAAEIEAKGYSAISSGIGDAAQLYQQGRLKRDEMDLQARREDEARRERRALHEEDALRSTAQFSQEQFNKLRDDIASARAKGLRLSDEKEAKWKRFQEDYSGAVANTQNLLPYQQQQAIQRLLPRMNEFVPDTVVEKPELAPGFVANYIPGQGWQAHAAPKDQQSLDRAKEASGLAKERATLMKARADRTLPPADRDWAASRLRYIDSRLAVLTASSTPSVGVPPEPSSPDVDELTLPPIPTKVPGVQPVVDEIGDVWDVYPDGTAKFRRKGDKPSNPHETSDKQRTTLGTELSRQLDSVSKAREALAKMRELSASPEDIQEQVDLIASLKKMASTTQARYDALNPPAARTAIGQASQPVPLDAFPTPQSRLPPLPATVAFTPVSPQSSTPADVPVEQPQAQPNKPVAATEEKVKALKAEAAASGNKELSEAADTAARLAPKLLNDTITPKEYVELAKAQDILDRNNKRLDTPSFRANQLDVPATSYADPGVAIGF